MRKMSPEQWNALTLALILSLSMLAGGCGSDSSRASQTVLRTFEISLMQNGAGDGSLTGHTIQSTGVVERWVMNGNSNRDSTLVGTVSKQQIINLQNYIDQIHLRSISLRKMGTEFRGIGYKDASGPHLITWNGTTQLPENITNLEKRLVAIIREANGNSARAVSTSVDGG